MLGFHPVGGAPVGSAGTLAGSTPVLATPVMQGGLGVLKVGFTWITVEWQDAVISEGSITGYGVSVNGGPYELVGMVNRYRSDWLKEGTPHVIAVRAYSDKGIYSASVSETVVTYPYPQTQWRRVFISGRTDMPVNAALVVVFPRS